MKKYKFKFLPGKNPFRAIWWSNLWGGFFFSWLVLFFGSPTTLPVLAAKNLKLQAGPFQQTVKVAELEEFVKTGKISSRFKPYKLLLTPQVRQLLSTSLQVNPQIAHKFLEELLRYPDGERLIAQLLAALPTSSVPELEAALNRTVQESNNFSVLSLLRAFPEDSVTVDLPALLGIAVQLNSYHLQNQFLGTLLERDLWTNTDRDSLLSFDPANRGTAKVIKHSWGFQDVKRNRLIPADVYYSLNVSGPLVIISPGFGNDRFSLEYLAYHLASHGLSVVALEHPGSNLESLEMGKNTLVREVMDEEAQPLRQLIQGLSLAFIQQMTPAASTYQPFLTSAYAQSYSTEAITLRWTSQLPISTKAWLKILSFNPQRITQRHSPKQALLNKRWIVNLKTFKCLLNQLQNQQPLRCWGLGVKEELMLPIPYTLTPGARRTSIISPFPAWVEKLILNTPYSPSQSKF